MTEHDDAGPEGRASLPMYAAPSDAVATFWAGLRDHMRDAGLTDVPDALCRPTDLLAHWRRPDLLLSQTCGFPLVTSLAGQVRYVATPRYRARGCNGAFYSSAVVVRADDDVEGLAGLAGRRVAVNAHDSQSGMNALRAMIAPLASGLRFFAEVIETGAHRASVAAVRTSRADVAAIDAVTWALLARDQPDETETLRVLTFSGEAPGLPLVTALSTPAADVGRLRSALARACADETLAACRADLLIDGFEVLPSDAYDSILQMQDAAVGRGYPLII